MKRVSRIDCIVGADAPAEGTPREDLLGFTSEVNEMVRAADSANEQLALSIGCTHRSAGHIPLS